MKKVLLVVGTTLLLFALVVAAFGVLSSPAQWIAFLSIAITEKGPLLAFVALLGAAIAWPVVRRRGRAIVALLLVSALTLVALPLVALVRLAWARGVNLDVGRYLAAPVDLGPPAPDATLPFATVAGQQLSLDLYRPRAGGRSPAPVVVVVHGGSWSAGDKGEVALTSRRLADRGHVVFDIQYRLRPQPNWTTAVADVKCALGWIRRNATSFGVTLDPKRIVLLGRSAGGHLALLAAYTAGDPAWPTSCPADNEGVAAVIAFYAPTDLVWGYQNPTDPRVYDSGAKLRAFLGGTPAQVPDAYRRASVVNVVRPRAPKTLLIHGLADQLVGAAHAQFLSERLKAVGVSHDVLLLPYAQHGFDYVYGGLSGQIAEAAIDRVLIH